MGSIGGGKIGSSTSTTTIIIPEGGKIVWKNSKGFAVFSVDEFGNIRHRGKIGRTSRV